ncbi:MAG: AraC family transcriptional regulator [Oscillospiraceae bacterium]|nr:AraC family transcriptional regulator [Oscillospiraceae bacterium]
MTNYAKSPVSNVVTVTSIATALRADLRNRIAGTESHDFPEIFFMAEGKGYTVVNGTRHDLKAGQMILYAANSAHGEGTGGIAEVISFETAAPLPKQYCDQVITLTGEQVIRFRTIVQQAQPLLEHRIGVRGMVLKKHVDPYAVQRIKNELELFLLDLMRPAERYEVQKMNAVTDYMMRNLHKSLTLREICLELGISEASLKRLVRQTCGQSPLAYFTDLKIAQAEWLILHSSMNMTQIAEQLGFSSVHYFSRIFKQKTGETPTACKKFSYK